MNQTPDGNKSNDSLCYVDFTGNSLDLTRNRAKSHTTNLNTKVLNISII